MTKTTPKTVVKAHRGMAHVPRRGRRRPPIQRRPVGDPRRRRPPIQQPTGRRMTPAQRDAMRRQQELVRRRFNQQRRRKTPTQAQRDAARRFMQSQRRQREALNREALKPSDRPVLPLQRRPTVEQLRNAKRRRRPTGDPKPRTRVTKARQTPRTRRKPQRPV